MMNLHIGFDDTDSPRGGCTTYIASLLVERLQKEGLSFTDYPNLVRLNPNVPWKTRGNGAICLRTLCSLNILHTIFETVAGTVEANADLGFKDTDPGIVFFQGAEIPREIRQFARRTIQSIVTKEEALRLVRKFGAEPLAYGKGYGIVGALAAIGETLEQDHTYELIAYRTRENRGTDRGIAPASVRGMNEKTAPQTFNNIDGETGRVLITPRGPDPILYGIRGETAEAVIRASRIVRPLEPIERWVVFRTNHGTDAHLRKIEAISDAKPYHPIIVEGVVSAPPRVIHKRHRVFSIEDETGEMDCAAYEPTGLLRKTARHLIIGDTVEVSGGVAPQTAKHPLTINLEKLRITRLTPKLLKRNPECPECGKRMKSKGRHQGFRCYRCGFKSWSAQPATLAESRSITEGLFITSPRSQRHLTKPSCRYGREKVNKPRKMTQIWHDP
jgi:tRNA(Ile2)-agmatinylcytidine synthase